MKTERNFWKNKKVFVTGHTGFKGSWLTLWLESLGAKIAGYSLLPHKLSLFNQLNLKNKCINHFEDIRDAETLEKVIMEFDPDIVFHLAAQPLVGFSYLNPSETWATNVMGTVNLLNSLRKINNFCVTLIITTDKVYKNKEWEHAYREIDALGGDDPYSSSKAAVEIAIESWRSSFCGNLAHQNPLLRVASARAGNVIGGGDWVRSRIVPDLIYGLHNKEEVLIRNPESTRPWQHVLEPLSGYLRLAELMYLNKENQLLDSSFNFGPNLQSNYSVRELVNQCLNYWDGEVVEQDNIKAPHEAGLLNISIEKAHHLLGWDPTWDFEKTVKKTILWYKKVLENEKSHLDSCLSDLNDFQDDLEKNSNPFCK